jgi:hypothetical protein
MKAASMTIFALMEEQTTFSVAGTTCRVSVELLDGYRYAQVFAPKDTDYVALEPMTAPTNALASGLGSASCRRVSDSERLPNRYRVGP